MSTSMVVAATVTVDGLQLISNITQAASGDKGHNDTLANVGLAGTLSTRTDDNTGILTVAADHGITADDTVCVFWSGGMRSGVDVTAVDATTISIDLGAGDNLPVVDTAIVVGMCEDITFVVTGANVKGLAISCNKRCHVDFQDVGGSELPLEIVAGGGWNWTYDSGLTNPIDGDSIIIIQAASGETTAGVLKVKCLYDDTP